MKLLKSTKIYKGGFINKVLTLSSWLGITILCTNPKFILASIVHPIIDISSNIRYLMCAHHSKECTYSNRIVSMCCRNSDMVVKKMTSSMKIETCVNHYIRTNMYVSQKKIVSFWCIEQNDK